MKKLLILLLLVPMLGMEAYSQDFIYTKSNTRIAAKIIELGIGEVQYKEYNNPDGPVIAIKNNDISLIAFEDGHLEFFEPVKKIVMRNDFNKNLLTYHLADLIFNNFTLSYEHISKNGKTGFEIPISFGYGNHAQVDDMYNQFYTGLNLNFYPTGQGKWRFLTGPGLRIGVARWDYGYYNGDNVGCYVDYDENSGYIKFMVNNGVIFTPIKALSFSIVGSIGIRYLFTIPRDYKYQVRTTGAIAVNLSYRF
jgi:hypothetical protein